ncbi:helix-turn-helix domain-containing protein [uncultured Porticoccus sp.]
MQYQQYSLSDRYIIAALKKQGLSIQQIANQMGRHRSTLYRELVRSLPCH